MKLNHGVTAEELKAGGFDDVIIATGIKPRMPAIDGIKHSVCTRACIVVVSHQSILLQKVLSYIDVIKHKKAVGKRVAIIGAGSIAALTSHT